MHAHELCALILVHACTSTQGRVPTHYLLTPACAHLHLHTCAQAGTENLKRTLGHEQHAELHLGHNLGLLLVQHGVRSEQFAANALSDAQASTRVDDVAEREGHLGVRLLDLIQGLTCRLHLEVVLGVACALEDSALGVELAALALARRHNDIYRVRLEGLEDALGHLVPRHMLVRDDLRASASR